MSYTEQIGEGQGGERDSAHRNQATYQSRFQSADWYRALTLKERIASLHAGSRKPSSVAVDVEKATRRLRRWCSQSPFDEDAYFAQRLAADGFTEETFRQLLGEPIKAVRDRVSAPPNWLTRLAEAFSRPIATDPLMIPEVFSGQDVALFLNVIEPSIHRARERMREGIQALTRTNSYLPFDPDTIEEMLYESLAERLTMRLSRLMVLELNVARVQGLLKGDTPQARFQHFCKRLRQPDVALSILEEYPVLAQQLDICTENWLTVSIEFLHRLCADWETIRTTFSPEEQTGVLVALKGSAGDSHRDGRSVMIAEFSSGFRVVYKPKPMAVDVHFQELLTWLNERGNHPPFQTLRILNRGTYGWVEFIAAQGCASQEAVRRFYQRQGGYIALLYALEATDFHAENLIASGEHPILIDLEAIFHPHVKQMDISNAEILASRTLSHSVLRVGLLPQRSWGNEKSDGLDLSGLGTAAGQMTPFSVSLWTDLGTDKMRLIREPVEMAAQDNQPTLRGENVDVLAYTEEIISGFTTLYRLLEKHRDLLLSEDGPLAKFALDEVRVIPRSTRIYLLLLQESFHPDVLRDALDRDRWFDRLWGEVKDFPILAKISPAEQHDLRNGDVPMFTTLPSSCDLWTSSNERIPDFFDESGMAQVQRRIQRFSEGDLKKQLWFISASLTALAADEHGTNLPAYQLNETPPEAPPERLLEAAREIGNRLETLALRGKGDDTTWIGLRLTAQRHWSLTPSAIDLYNGLPGIALFLAYLGEITQEKRYTTLAQEALTTIRRRVSYSGSNSTSIGAFDGWGGIIYMLSHLSTLWNQPEPLAEAEEILKRLPGCIEQDDGFDIIGGAAGCIAALISLYRCAPSSRTLDAAVQCGDHLIANAQPMTAGIGWVSRISPTVPLTGFSHGTAGIAWVLLELSSLTGEKRFRAAALDAIVYERHLFSPEVQNWPDFREDDTPEQRKNERYTGARYTTAWCHGAPGIGLGRLSSRKHIDDEAIRAEINVALSTTLLHGFGANHSLCHGDLGNLELLSAASQSLDEPRWETEVQRIAGGVLQSIDTHGWRCGVPLRVETPGLMTGLAGIGYGLLRLAEPTRVPSVLTLAPPIQTTAQ